MLSLARWCRTRSNEATPLSSQATASPSMMQERGAQACQGLDNQREAAGEIVARTAVKPHPRASLARNDAEAVVLDLMQPLAAGWQLIGFAWEARRDELGREGRLQHAAPRKIRTDCLARFVLPIRNIFNALETLVSEVHQHGTASESFWREQKNFSTDAVAE